MVERDKRVNLLVSEEERTMLDELAEKDGLTISDWLRLTIRRAHAAAFPTPTPRAS